MKLKTESKELLFYIASFLFLYALVFSIYPLADDWTYLSSPNVHLSVYALLPRKTFWRPFDALFGGLVGLFPSAFPYFNRAVVVLSHVMTAFLLCRISRRLGFSEKVVRFCALFFMFSSAVPAVIVSPDAVNQSCSLLFGLIGLNLYLKKPNLLYLVFSLLSLFWKESGVSWFIVIPLVSLVSESVTLKELFKDKRKLCRLVVFEIISVITVLLYFVVRFALFGSFQLGTSDGTYSISIFSASFFKNVFLLLASAMTGVDSIALLSSQKNYILVAVTALLSIAFLIFVAIKAFSMLKKNKTVFPAFVLLAVIACLIFPHAILQNAGEMHAYPVLFGVTLFFGYIFNNTDFDFKKAVLPVTCIFLAFAISFSHKMISVYDYSERTKILDDKLFTLHESEKSETLIIVVGFEKGYSVFDQQAMYGIDFGYSLMSRYGWESLPIAREMVDSREEAITCLEENKEYYNCIILLDGESAERLK